MDSWDLILLVAGVLWLTGTIGFLLSIVIELLQWLWSGRKGVVRAEEDHE